MPPWLPCLDQVLLLDLPPRRRRSYLCFACAMFVALGSHQFVVAVKTTLFLDTVGTQMEPIAKTLVMVVLIPVLVLYGLLVSRVEDPKRMVLFVCAAFSAIYLLVVTGVLLEAHKTSTWPAWLLYYATETKGVIVMPMIWSVVADVSTPELASKAYPMIFFVIQLGGIVGSWAAIEVRSLGGEVGLLLLQAGCLLLVALLTWAACDQLNGSGEAAPLSPAEGARDAEGGGGGGGGGPVVAAKEAPDSSLLGVLGGSVEGLWLLLSRPYVLGAFWVSYATLVPRTILDYQNSVLVVAAFESRSDQIAYMGRVTLIMNSLAGLLTLVGTRPIVETFGVGSALLVLPLTMLGCMLALCASYGLQTSSWALIISCTVAYGLNAPCKEMLFVRTSRDIKYKAKAWSEMYGNQVMKLLGAQMNLWVNLESPACHPDCFRRGPTSMVTAAWVGLWLVVAFHVGREHGRLEREDKKVA